MRMLIFTGLIGCLIGLLIVHKDVVYNSQVGDSRCHDTIDYQAFYSIHTGIEYCFYKKTVYPYRVWGGIIGIK